MRMEPNTPTLPESVPPMYEPVGYGTPGDDARFVTTDHDERYGGWHQPPQDPPPKQGFIKRRLAPIGAAIIAFLAKIKTIIFLLPKAKLLVTAGADVCLVRAVPAVRGR